MEPTITPGTVLDGPSILALCQARDLGVAAGTADPANPPDSLRGVAPSRWPQLVAEGRQAVTDLVGSVLPMVYAQTRRTPNAADTRGQMFVELMGAAYRFDPQRTSPEGWASYAWMTLKHARWRGVDDAGVVRKRTSAPRPATLPLEGREPASRTPDPGEVVEDRHAVAAITQALGQLPTSLREPLMASMQGHPLREIAEDLGYSESTAHRRIKEAREHIRDDLASHVDDRPWVPFDTGTDPVLECARRQRADILAVARSGAGPRARPLSVHARPDVGIAQTPSSKGRRGVRAPGAGRQPPCQSPTATLERLRRSDSNDRIAPGQPRAHGALT